MTAAQAAHSDPTDDLAELIATCQRFASIDSPALHSRAVDLQRVSDESSASATPQAAPAVQTKATLSSDKAESPAESR